METARNIATVQTKKLREYVKPREYLSGEVNLRVRSILGRRYTYGRRAGMERLTRVIKGYGNDVIVYTQGKHTDTTNGEMEYKDVRNVMKHLCEYENTELTSLEIIELKERDTEYFCKTSIFDHESVVCKCGNDIEKDSGFNFCPYCGQRIKWEE